VPGLRSRGFWLAANSAKPGIDEADVQIILKGWIAARDYFRTAATLPDSSDSARLGVGEAKGNMHCIKGDSPGVIITPGTGPIRFAFGVSFPTAERR
jgi:hypothetical protein